MVIKIMIRSLKILLVLIFGVIYCTQAASINRNLSISPVLATLKPFTIRIPDIILDPTLGGKRGNPGFQLEITTKGLNYANRVAANILNSEIRSLRIPDFRKAISGGYIKARQMSITSYQEPAFRYQLLPDRKFSWGLSGAKISMKGKWQGKKKVAIVPISGSGSFKASASDVSIQISASFLRTTGGKPVVSGVACSARIGRLSVDISGGIVGWLLDLFSGKIADMLKPILQNEVCKLAKTFVNEDVNSKLRTFPTLATINRNFKPDYGLSAHPAITRSLVESNHKGEILYRGRRNTPFYPHKLAGSPSSSKMLYLRVSDYVLNSFLYQAHINNASKYVITSRTLPEASRFLRISCPGSFCLGSVFPDLARRYPNGKGELTIGTSRKPVSFFSNGKATVAGAGELKLVIVDNGRRILLFMSKLYGSGELKVRISGGSKILGEAKITKLRLSQPSNLSIPLQTLADLAKPIIEAQINKYFAQGVQLPVIRGVRFVNSNLSFLQRTLEVSTDVVYNS